MCFPEPEVDSVEQKSYWVLDQNSLVFLDFQLGLAKISHYRILAGGRREPRHLSSYSFFLVHGLGSECLFICIHTSSSPFSRSYSSCQVPVIFFLLNLSTPFIKLFNPWMCYLFHSKTSNDMFVSSGIILLHREH